MIKIKNEHYRIDPETGKRTVEKKSYNTQGEAYKFILDNYDDRRDWCVYRCLICGKFHIGHSNRISFEEKYREAKKEIKYLKALLLKREKELLKLKEKYVDA